MIFKNMVNFTHRIENWLAFLSVNHNIKNRCTRNIYMIDADFGGQQYPPASTPRLPLGTFPRQFFLSLMTVISPSYVLCTSILLVNIYSQGIHYRDRSSLSSVLNLQIFQYDVSLSDTCNSPRPVFDSVLSTWDWHAA